MKSYKDIITESVRAKIYTNKNINGYALIRKFDEKENNILVKALKDHERSDYELMDMLDDIESEVKYSETLLVSYKGLMFSLYAANGRLRLGGQQKAAEIKSLDVKELADAIKNSRIN